MKKILLIEICNYTDYPIGGHLSFVKNMLNAFGNDLALVGCSTDDTPVGRWVKKEIDNIEYDYFSVKKVKKISKQPLVPQRLVAYYFLRKYVSRVLKYPYETIFIQTPEVLFALPTRVLGNCHIRMPGVDSPLTGSRYWYGKYLASIFDFFFFRKITKCRKILATADTNSISDFVGRSKGVLHKEAITQYPTRYNQDIFYPFPNVIRNSGQINVVTVGRLAWGKGWKFMIDSFVLFHKRRPESFLYFIGEGEDEQQIVDYINKNELNDCVTLLGRRPLEFIADYLNRSEVFIMGSYVEGWSTALVEACACGIPCVVTKFSSSEMVGEGKNGFVVQQRDEALFAQKISEALAVPRDKVIEYSRNFVELSVQNMKKSLSEIIAP